MKRKMLFHGRSRPDEEVWDTGKRRTETVKSGKSHVWNTYHKVKRKGFFGLSYYSWVHELTLRECPKVEYWEDNEE